MTPVERRTMRERVHSKLMACLSSPHVPIHGKRELVLFLYRLATLRPLFMLTDPDACMSALMLECFIGVLFAGAGQVR